MHLLESSCSSPLVFLFLHPSIFWNSFIYFLSNGELSYCLLFLLIKLYIPVTRFISLLSHINTNLRCSHAHLPVVYLMFRAITCRLVPVHFEFPHHKYIIPFLFIFGKLKHSPLSNVLLRLIIFSLLILPPSAPLSSAPWFSCEILALYKLYLVTYLLFICIHLMFVSV